LITFHYNNELDFHRANFGLEQFVQRYYDEKNKVVNFLQVLPLTYDPVSSYPITAGRVTDTDLLYSLAPLYKDLFCEIVCQTFFSGKTFHLTEKIIRPILYKRPFIIQGPKHFIKNLKLLGFKTFDQWWDEGYDQDHHDSRYETVTNNIEWIASQTPATIAEWFKEMQPTFIAKSNTKDLRPESVSRNHRIRLFLLSRFKSLESVCLFSIFIESILHSSTVNST
jgi:hypothetical protein